MKIILTKSSLLLTICMLLIGFTSNAQEKKASPAAEASGKIGDATITINYSSPSVKERTIWGELVPYGKVWRAGANEATTFETDKDVKIEGQSLAAGKYAFFTIPGEKEWTIIFNKNAKQWGAYSYDEKEDVLRVTVKPKKSSEMKERLEYSVNDNGIVLSWENLDVPVAVK